ncbi:MAG: HEAT repeat domain-containing protein [Phycisphaerales bacterium]|nr:HEAT repeat domain-containing protein [Phycisphaerales bacterium]
MIPPRLRIRASTVLPFVGACLVLSSPFARGDIFHMKNGETIEVEILEDQGESYRVRTLIGIVNVEKDTVAKIKKKKCPWQRYAKKLKNCPNTAEGHYKLAQWCGQQNLGPERLDELEKVIELDPDHAQARKLLDYIKNDKGKWIKKPSPNAPTPEELAARRQQREEEKLIRDLITDWFVKIKAIHRSRMDGKKRGPRTEKFRKGREQLLAIRDPLALPALTGVLSTGKTATRHVLVEVLSQFDEDEATMNLLVITLLDPSETVRKAAAIELISRNDDRVIARLRDALGSKEEHILRNAATALGILKAGVAVDDLINVLSKETRRSVRVSRMVSIGDIYSTFGGYRRVAHGRRLLRYQPTSIGVLGTSTMIGSVSHYEDQIVSIHRTEVQEALIAITGQNFGFDMDAWRLWLRQQGR